MTGTAQGDVTPTKSGTSSTSLQCFCFTEQRLGSRRNRDIGMQFFVDPELLKDPSTRDVNTITLSYTMFRGAPRPGGESGAARRLVGPGQRPKQ